MKRTIFAAIMLIAASYCYAGNESKSIANEPDDDFGYETLPPVTNASSTPVGTIEGNFDVSQTGAAVYTMAIEAPKGLGNMQPAIGISYNSQAGNGIAGWGTNITGLSVITRGMKDLYHDGTVKGMTFLADDAYYLDGKRLIHISGTEGQEGAVYQLEGDPFTVITFHGYYNSVTADTWMDVRRPDGRYYEYGHSNSARQSYTNKSGNSRIHAWYINHQKDQQGNYITYQYNTRNHYTYPTQITYGKNTQTENDLNNSIDFTYSLGRSDTQSFIMEDTKGKMDVRLRDIKTVSNYQTYRTYNFQYDSSTGSSTSKCSRLSQVSVSNENGETLPATKFEWLTSNTFSLQASKVGIGLEDSNSSVKKQNMHFLNADVNGDGIDDIIRVSDVKDYTFGNRAQNISKTYAYIYKSLLSGDGKVNFSPAVRYSVSPSIAWNDWNFTDKRNFAFDFDGDGYSDLLFPYCRRNANISQFSFDVLLGKNITDNDNSIISISKSLVGSERPVYTLGDYNGDGRGDVLFVEKALNGGKYPGSMVTYSDSGQAIFEDLSLNLPKNPQNMFSGDYNNDGLTDVIIFYEGGFSIYYNNTGNSLLTRFSDANKKTGTNFGYNWRMAQGDFNGDGQTDFLYVGGGSNKYYFALNNGDGTFTTSLALESSLQDQSTNKDNDQFSIMVRDINNDGNSDVIIVKSMYVHHGGLKARNDFRDTGISWLLSDGSKLCEMRYVKTYNIEDSKWYNLMIGNFSGDGNMELMNYGNDFYTNTTASGDVALRVYKEKIPSAGLGKINQITDGMGNVITIDYVAARNVYTQKNDAQFPVVDLPISFPMVKTVTQANGAAETIIRNYLYEGLKAHVQGKGLLGMTSFKSECPKLGEKKENSITNWNSQFFIPSEIKIKTTLETETSSIVTTYQITPKPNNNYLATPLSLRETDFDGNVTETIYTYNTDFGYITSQKTTYGQNENLYKAVDYSDYIQKAGRYVPCTVMFRQKHFHDATEYSDKSAFAYDDYGRVTKEIKHAEAMLSLTTERSYDSFGNVLSSKSYGYGVTPLTEFFTYDTSGRFMTSRYNSVVSSPVNYTYDSWGNITTETDNTFVPQTPQSLHYEYDGWGNLTKTIHPDGTILSRSFGSGKTQEKKYYVLEQGTAIPWTVTWYDSKGREVQILSVNRNNRKNSKTISYNIYGKPVRVSSSNDGTIYIDNFDYDARGRIVKNQTNLGSTKEYSYSGYSITETIDGNVFRKVYDAVGNLLQSCDPLSSVTYTYNSQWKPIAVNSENATISIDYDEVGNRISLTDSDAGIMSYDYDAFGRIMTQTDSKGNETNNEYNALGQLTASTVNGMTTSYVYGTSGADNMQLKKVAVNGNIMEYTYDNLRRLIQKKQTIDGLDVMEYNFSYGATGLVSSKTYPNNLTENYGYDCYGNRTSMSVNDNVLLKYQPCRQFERITPNHQTNNIQNVSNATLINSQLRDNSSSFSPLPNLELPFFVGKTDKWKLLGGSLVLENDYDSGGFLIERKLNKGDNTVSQMSYSYDTKNGNLLSRTHHQQTETFTYDVLDRLTGVNLEGATTMQMDYDISGNIASKTGLGSYSYDENKTHAVVSVENTNNILPLSTQTISYNDFGKVENITDGNYTMSFVYGPDLERWKTELRNGQNVTCTTLYGDGYERIIENGTTRHFYYLEGGVLCVKQDGQPDQFYYMNTDHQGSILSIVDANGSSVFEADYDAWGKQTVTLNTIGFHRGYTGHEMLPEFGLINMNGRLYNPDLGRFLSPDNFVQAPDFSQNFNRYSYCLNNPLKYIDPTGMDYWHTNDPDQINAFWRDVINGRDPDMSDWDHTSDAEFLAHLSYNDKSGSFSYSYGTVINGEVYIMGTVFKPDRIGLQSAYNFYCAQNGMQQGNLFSSLPYLQGINTIADGMGGSLKNNAGNSTLGNNSKFYWHSAGERGFNGNQYVRTIRLNDMGKRIVKVAGPVGKLFDFYDLYNGFQLDGGQFETIGYYTFRSGAGIIGGWIGSWAGIRVGGVMGEFIVGPPGAIIGGIGLGIFGSYYGSMAGTTLIDDIW